MRYLGFIAVATLLALAPPLGASAGSVRTIAENTEPTPGQEIDRVMRNVMRTLRHLFQAIPQYKMPEFNDNGDIIIRRVHPPDEKSTAPEHPDRTDT